MRIPTTRRLCLLAVPLAVLLLAAGCAGTAPAKGSFIADTRLVLDSELQGRIAVGPESVVPATSAGPMRVEVTVTNVTDQAIDSAYRFEWRNATGAPVHSDSAQWLPLKLAAGAATKLRATAPGPDAVAYTIKLLDDGP